MYEGRNHASFATFVRVCATRLTLDHLRALARRPQVAADQPCGDDLHDVLVETPDAALGPEDHASISEELMILRRLVSELSPREQLLVRLHFIEGLDISDVARALNVSENATHVLKSRLRAKLRSKMQGEAGENA